MAEYDVVVTIPTPRIGIGRHLRSSESESKIYVFVNGEVAFEKGEVVGNRRGQVLRHAL